MKRIGLMTLHHATVSYGACLQGFALWYYLSKNNTCEMINLVVTSSDEHKETVIIRLKVFIYNCLIFLKYLWKKCYRKAKNDSETRVRRFEAFNSQIKMSAECWTNKRLYNTPPSYDVWVSGSDQLWNSRIGFDIEPYLLGFTLDEDKRVSYASSLGVLEITQYYEPLFKRTIPRFHSIAMREASAIPVIQKYTNIKIENVLDPTFLLSKSEWRSKENEYIISENYLICYFLGYTREIIDYCKRQAKHLGLAPVFISTNPSDVLSFTDVKFLQDVGPSEFLYLFDKSEFVLTDSFHGTVFAIIFEKQFVTYIGKNIKASTRITDLLTSLGIENNVIQSLLVKDSNLNYQVVNEFLNKRITHSEEYLNNAIA